MEGPCSAVAQDCMGANVPHPVPDNANQGTCMTNNSCLNLDNSQVASICTDASIMGNGSMSSMQMQSNGQLEQPQMQQGQTQPQMQMQQAQMQMPQAQIQMPQAQPQMQVGQPQ